MFFRSAENGPERASDGRFGSPFWRLKGTHTHTHTHKGWKWGRSGVLQTPYFIERRSAKIGKSSSRRFQKQGNHRADFQESASGSRLVTEILLWPKERRPSGFTFPYKTHAKPPTFNLRRSYKDRARTGGGGKGRGLSS